MNVVLYTVEMEPITVIDLMPKWVDRLRSGEHIVLAVIPKFDFATMTSGSANTVFDMRVEIWAERFVFRGSEMFMLFTYDDVNALALKASFLPGQNREVQQRMRQAYVTGLSDAFRALGG